MSQDIVVSSEVKNQKNPTEAEAATALTRLFYAKCGPNLLGWCDVTQEPRHWKFKWFRFFEPVNDHLKGDFRGLVATQARCAPIIVDFDRHDLAIAPSEFSKFVLNSFDWLKSNFPAINWAAAEVNPKNGSTKIYGFNGVNAFDIEEAKEIASIIKKRLSVEVYPIDSQMMLPMRKDKVTVVASGILGRCKRYRMVMDRYENKKRRRYYRTYSALDFAGNLISKKDLCRDTLEKALLWSATMPSGKLNPKNIEHVGFAQLYRRVRNKALVEKMWDFTTDQPVQYFLESWKLMFQSFDCLEPDEIVIDDFIRRYSRRLITSRLAPRLNSNSQESPSQLTAPMISPTATASPKAKSRSLSELECELVRTEWLKGGEDAFKRDGLLTKAIFRILNGQPSEDFVIKAKEDLQLYTGEFDERKARNRISWCISFTANTFQSSRSGVSTDVIDRYVNEARKIIRNQIWYDEKRRTKSGFDDRGMPVGEWKFQTKLVSKEKARQMVAGVLNSVDYAVENENGSTSTKFIKQTMSKMFGWFDWSIYKTIRKLLEELGVVEITDKNHTVGKCWIWQRGKKKAGGVAVRRLYLPPHLNSLVALSDKFKRTSFIQCDVSAETLLRPPD